MLPSGVGSMGRSSLEDEEDGGGVLKKGFLITISTN